MAFAQRIITSNSAGDQEFTFTFDYIKEEHIKVFVNFVEKAQGTGSNEFQVITNTTPKKISLNTGLSADNTRVEIRRVSSLSTPLVDFEDGSTLTAADLDTAEKQSLFIAQELDDALKQGISIDTSTGIPTLGSQRLSNVADPVNAQDVVTKNYLERSGSITSTQIADGTIVDADINASAAIAGSKLQASSGSNAGSMSAANFTKLAGIESGATADQTNAEIRAAVEAASDSNVFTDADHTKLNNIEANATADQTNAEIRAAVEAASDSNVFTDADHTKLNNIEANATADQTVTEIKSLIAGSPLDASHLAANSVTLSEIADAELTTLAGMQSGTASKLADSTALTADIADLNQLDGMAKQTTITNSDSHFPTSGAVVDFVANQIAPVGGLEVIADEDSFPATQPVSGVVISISNADGLVINSSGVATNARTVGNGSDNVTINNFPTSLRNKTLSNELGLLVSSTGASQEYNYHKLLAKETDVLQLSDDINDFNNRYRVENTLPAANDSSNHDGDLVYAKDVGKIYVYSGDYNGTPVGSFGEVQSIGNFFISTLSPAFNGSLQDFTITNAPSNAEQIILSINGVIQKPNSGTSTPSEGFALSGSTVKLAAAPASGSDYFAIVIGSTVNIGTPSNNTVTSAILQNGSVVEAKLGSGAVTRTKLNLVSTSSAPGLEVKGDGSSDGYLQLNCSQNSHGIKLKSPPHSAGQSYTLTFPPNIVNGQFLKTDANGNLSWAAVVTDLVNDTSPQLGGNLDTNGNAVKFADNIQANFGTGDDSAVRFNGTDLVITTAGKIKSYAGNTGFEFYSNDNSDIFAKFIKDGAVELYHDNSKKLETFADGIKVVDDGSVVEIELITNSSAVRGKVTADSGNQVILATATDENMLIAKADGAVELYHDNVKKLETTSGGAKVSGDLDVVGHAFPNANNTYDLGTSGNRWRNIYTNDLNLSNEGGANDVDGTWGSYTIQEGADDLFLVNKRNGKKYKFNLTEVN